MTPLMLRIVNNSTATGTFNGTAIDASDTIYTQLGSIQVVVDSSGTITEIKQGSTALTISSTGSATSVASVEMGVPSKAGGFYVVASS